MSISTAKKEPDREDLEEQIRVIRDDVAKLTGLIREIAESRTASARDAAIGHAREVADASERAVRTAKARAEHGADALEHYVADKPLQSTLFALGLGLVLGWMSRR